MSGVTSTGKPKLRSEWPVCLLHCYDNAPLLPVASQAEFEERGVMHRVMAQLTSPSIQSATLVLRLLSEYVPSSHLFQPSKIGISPEVAERQFRHRSPGEGAKAGERSRIRLAACRACLANNASTPSRHCSTETQSSESK